MKSAKEIAEEIVVEMVKRLARELNKNGEGVADFSYVEKTISQALEQYASERVWESQASVLPWTRGFEDGLKKAQPEIARLKVVSEKIVDKLKLIVTARCEYQSGLYDFKDTIYIAKEALKLYEEISQ